MQVILGDLNVLIIWFPMWVVSGSWGQRGQNIFGGKVADGEKRSHVNKVSFNGLGSRACLGNWVFLCWIAFSLFSRYHSMIFLKQLNTNISWYNCPSNRKNFSLYIHAPRTWSPYWLDICFWQFCKICNIGYLKTDAEWSEAKKFFQMYSLFKCLKLSFLGQFLVGGQDQGHGPYGPLGPPLVVMMKDECIVSQLLIMLLIKSVVTLWIPVALIFIFRAVNCNSPFHH